MKNSTLLIIGLFYFVFLTDCKKKEEPQTPSYSNLVWASEIFKDFDADNLPQPRVSEDYIILLEYSFIIGDGSRICVHKFDKKTGEYLGKSLKFEHNNFKYSHIFGNYLIFGNDTSPAKLSILNIDDFTIESVNLGPSSGGQFLQGEDGMIYLNTDGGIVSYDLTMMTSMEISLPVCWSGVTVFSNVWNNPANGNLIAFKCNSGPNIHVYHFTAGIILEIEMPNFNVGLGLKPSIFIEQGKVWYFNSDGILDPLMRCTDIETGDLVWEKEGMAWWGKAEDKLLFRDENELIALDMLTGQEAWRVSEPTSFSNFVVYNGSFYYTGGLVSDSNYLIGRSIENGSEVFSLKSEGEIFGKFCSIEQSSGRAWLFGDKRLLCFQL